MNIPGWMLTTLEILTGLFILSVGVLVLVLLVLFVIDKFQTESTVKRNYPVIGRFRFLFEHLGEFFRQYFFAMDREEMPFNRAQRTWAYRASKDINNTAAFGSTKDLRPEGTVIFANCPFPPLEDEKNEPTPIKFGPHCEKPYQTTSIFNISGMSYGALSRPAVRALSYGAAKAGIWLNTGEGGLAPAHLEGGCDVVYQIGTAKYGVRDDKGLLCDDKLKAMAAHDSVRMFELKLAQGAKPGKGGILPAAKVNAEIAEIRGIPEGEPSISPNRHPDIGNCAQLLDVIDRIRRVTGKPVGIKVVLSSAAWLDELGQEIHQRGVESAPDFITVDSGDGGTGAAPQPLMDEMGLPLREALPMLVDKLHEYSLTRRVRVVASGKRITPAEVAWALCAGADAVTNARGFMFALGCIQALQCNKNTCPTGITTHDKSLQRGLVPKEKSRRVANYAKNIVKEVTIIAHSCGVSEPRRLARQHARVVTSNGLSVALNELHPEIPVRVEF